MGKYLEGLKKLSHWFERQKRVLPWRDEPSLYRVWISEIMLQQTQVITVIPYFERFTAKFPTVEKLAKADLDAVMLLWAGLGYYSRARNLHRGAQQIIAQGGFPRDREGWLEIPGVGDYTAGAILSIALNQPEAILDGNVERVLSRVRRVNRRGGDSAYKARLWRLARAFVEDGNRHGIRPSVVNQALMELGATICTPKKPKCLLCPLNDLCRAREFGDQETYPPRKKPKQWVEVREEVHCLLNEEGRAWVQKRAAGEWRAGLWDLPSERPGPEQLVEAEVSGRIRKLGVVETKHVVTRHKITRVTHVWRVEGSSKPLRKPLRKPLFARAGMLALSEPGRGTLARWVRLDEPDVAIGSALRKVFQRIRERDLG